MKTPPLSSRERALIESVFERYPRVESVRLFGSRAKGTHSERSDVDLAVFGHVSSLEAERIRSELDELPMPYHFDVQAFGAIGLQPLREHIQRVGVIVYSRGASSVEATTLPHSHRDEIGGRG